MKAVLIALGIVVFIVIVIVVATLYSAWQAGKAYDEKTKQP